MSKTSTVVKGAAIIAAGTLISRVLGYVREKAMFHTFGNEYITGAFNSAFSVPDLLYYLLAGGALSAAFIPVFSDYLAKKEQADANCTGSSIGNLMLLALIIGVALEIVFAEYVVKLVAPGYTNSPEVFQLTVSLTRMMCAMVIFTALSGLLTGILNSYHHFLAPTIVWNTYNIGIILGITVFSKLALFGGSAENPSIYGVAGGVLLGAVSMAVIQLPVVFKYGFRYSPIINMAHPGVRKVLVLFAPVMIGLSLIQLNLMLIPLMNASFVGTSAVTVIRAANRILLLPMGIFAVAISTAAFPRLSQLVALGEMQTFRETISRSVRAILLLSIPSSTIMFVLALPVTCLLFGGAKFDVEDVLASSAALSFFAWGLLGLSLLQIINRAFYSMKNMLTPVAVGLVMVVANGTLSYIAIRHFNQGYISIPFFTTVTYTLAVLVLYDILRRRVGGLDGRNTVVMTLKVLVASAVMGVVMLQVANHMAPQISDGNITGQMVTASLMFPLPAPHLTPIKDASMIGHLALPAKALATQVGASIIAGILVLVLMLKLLRVEELTFITDRLFARFRRRPTDSTMQTAEP